MDFLPKDIFAALPSVLGTAAVAPSLLLLWTVASMDNRREPTKVVLAAFLFGAGGALALSFLHIPIPGLSVLANWPIIQTYLHATFEVAAPEEAVKLFVLVFVCSRYIAYEHPMEGVVYGAAVGLGFAAYENLFYLTSNIEYWMTIAVVRGLFTVPVHGALAVIIGMYVAKARFRTGAPPGSRLSDQRLFHRMGDRRGPPWDVRLPAFAATTVGTGSKRPNDFADGNWHCRGRLGVCRGGTDNLFSQEIASCLAKFVCGRTPLSIPLMAPD